MLIKWIYKNVHDDIAGSWSGSAMIDRQIGVKKYQQNSWNSHKSLLELCGGSVFWKRIIHNQKRACLFQGSQTRMSIRHTYILRSNKPTSLNVHMNWPAFGSHCIIAESFAYFIAMVGNWICRRRSILWMLRKDHINSHSPIHPPSRGRKSIWVNPRMQVNRTHL